MGESEPGRVPAEGDSCYGPVGHDTVVVRKQYGGEEVDKERDVSRRPSWQSISSDRKSVV